MTDIKSSIVPTDVTGLQIYLDAYDYSTITFGAGTEMATWINKIKGVYTFTQAVAANRPNYTRSNAIDGTPSITMTVGDYFDINNDNLFDLPFTLFMVASFDDVTSGDTIIHRGALAVDDGAFVLETNNNIACGWETNPPLGAQTVGISGISNNKFYIITVRGVDTSTAGYINVNISSSDNTVSTLSGYPGATALTAEFGKFEGESKAFLLYNTEVSLANRRGIQQFLSKYYNAQLGVL